MIDALLNMTSLNFILLFIFLVVFLLSLSMMAFRPFKLRDFIMILGTSIIFLSTYVISIVVLRYFPFLQRVYAELSILLAIYAAIITSEKLGRPSRYFRRYLILLTAIILSFFLWAILLYLIEIL